MADGNSAMGPIWSESSRRPHSGVMGALSTEEERRSRAGLGEEGKTSEKSWVYEKAWREEEGGHWWLEAIATEATGKRQHTR